MNGVRDAQFLPNFCSGGTKKARIWDKSGQKIVQIFKFSEMTIGSPVYENCFYF